MPQSLVLFLLVLEKRFSLCLTTGQLEWEEGLEMGGDVFSLFNMKIPVKYTILSFVFKSYFINYILYL